MKCVHSFVDATLRDFAKEVCKHTSVKLNELEYEALVDTVEATLQAAQVTNPISEFMQRMICTNCGAMTARWKGDGEQ